MSKTQRASAGRTRSSIRYSRSPRTGTERLRAQAVVGLRSEMEDFYHRGSLAEVQFLKETLEMAYGERSFDGSNCAIAEAALWYLTGSGFRD